MKRPYELIPHVDTVLGLMPEELGAALLEHLNTLTPHDLQFLNGCNFGLPGNFEDYPTHQRPAVINAWSEGWAWLEREGLLVPKSGSDPTFVRVSSKGRTFKSRSDLEAYKKAALLPRSQLHRRIESRVFGHYIRGSYDEAVFSAFKEVEVAVREAGRYADTDYGVKLMGNAFKVESGPLTDMAAAPPERAATRNLFSGAIGLFKNPSSHRHVSFTAERCIELCLFATYLLSEVDERGSRGSSP